MAWQPGARAAALAMEVPYEGVPHHLWEPTWSWLHRYIASAPLVIQHVGIHLRIALPDAQQDRLAALDTLHAYCSRNDDLLLDAIEHVLPDIVEAYGQDEVKSLNALLRQGNSLYRVRDDGQGLEERIDVAVRDQVREVVEGASGSPGAHLTTAWNCAYGRISDPVKAYSEAIKAVEAAAAPVISPTNAKATLGSMIAVVRAKSSKWTFAIPAQGDDGVLAVLRMMEALWNGQTSRHGGNAPTQPEAPESARAAVHISATLVQLFISRAVALAGVRS